MYFGPYKPDLASELNSTLGQFEKPFRVVYRPYSLNSTLGIDSNLG